MTKDYPSSEDFEVGQPIKVLRSPWTRAVSDEPVYLGSLEPLHPCREMQTRHCPPSYEGVCGDRPCARYESDDETPWERELTHVERD